MKRIIHLIPYDGIGGVESAANTITEFRDNQINFSVKHVFQSPPNLLKALNPLSYFNALQKLISEKPDVLIVSLWRASLVGILYKALYRKTILVHFLHSCSDSHIVDFIVTRIATLLCNQVWADSTSSATQRYKTSWFRKFAGRISVISFVCRTVLPPTKAREPMPKFIFWGRLCAQKNISQALTIFSDIQRRHKNAHFLVIGPDAGELKSLKALVDRLNLTESVSFVGARSFDEIREASSSYNFYLQTSVAEGMAMSVVEAMQLGLVPIVTPVGEIGTYCIDDYNSIIVKNKEATVERVTALLENHARYVFLSENAIASWATVPLYSDSVIAACKELLARTALD